MGWVGEEKEGEKQKTKRKRSKRKVRFKIRKAVITVQVFREDR